ncbi:MAG: signal peptidase I [Kiritimatiellae bacterium]|nr:signal peptidase I [Kiritimatiellia bacterium]
MDYRNQVIFSHFIRLRPLFSRNRRAVAWRTTVLALLTLLIFGVWLHPVVVRGSSMEPTLSNGTWHLGTRWWMDSQRHPHRGAVVIIRRAGGQTFYLKRILALPKEAIAFRQGQLYINAVLVEEPYRSLHSDWTLPPVELGPDEYFVAGDNRSMPMADHAAGVIHRRSLAGELKL